MSTSPPLKKPALDDPYHLGDRIPVPEAQERDTDTAWQLFHELSQQQEQEHKFPPTVPGSVPAALATDLAPVDSAFAPTTPTGLRQDAALGDPGAVDALMHEARRNNRVCPRLDAWQQLYDMLPGKRQVGGQWEPPLPIPPQAWRVTSAMIKRLCLRDHLEWADRHGAAQQVLVFLRSIPEDQWLHME